MGLRIEWIALVTIAAMLVFSYLITADQKKREEYRFSKEMEVFHSTTIEVNSTGVESRLVSDYAVKEGKELRLKKVIYSEANIEELRADRGRYLDEKLYLDGHVYLLQKNGYIYQGEHAIYDKKKRVLDVTGRFSAYINRNIIHGSHLHYDLDEKSATAENIDAILYTDDEKKPHE